MIPGPNWARRYGGTQHRRLCARPGCGAPAAATLRFQPTQREAWLVDLDGAAVRTEGDLCSRHATGLVLPRGWQLHDERTDVPDVVVDAPAPYRRPRTSATMRPRRRRVARTDEPLPGLRAVPSPEPEAATEPEVVEVEAAVAPEVVAVEPEVVIAEAEPAADAERTFEAELSEPAREQLSDVLDAQTPLLRRAFQNVWPFSDDAQSS